MTAVPSVTEERTATEAPLPTQPPTETPQESTPAVIEGEAFIDISDFRFS